MEFVVAMMIILLGVHIVDREIPLWRKRQEAKRVKMREELTKVKE